MSNPSAARISVRHLTNRPGTLGSAVATGSYAGRSCRSIGQRPVPTLRWQADRLVLGVTPVFAFAHWSKKRVFLARIRYRKVLLHELNRSPEVPQLGRRMGWFLLGGKMDYVLLAPVAMHFVLALILFFLVNWIGKHAIDFGYVSTSLFEEPNESIALNFFIRALSPAVFIIIVSSAAVAVDRPELRLGIINVVPYYYVLRAVVIFLFNRHRLISWPRYIGHSIFGIAFAALAYNYLILPNLSLIPDLETAGNELWLALLAFLYAVANKITLSGGPGARRRNAFINSHYAAARARFGEQIDSKVSDKLLKLVVY